MIQNDILRFCENKRLEDRVPIEILHKNAYLVSLEQRRVKQLLFIMYKLSHIKSYRVEQEREHTRTTDKSNKVIQARNK